MTEVEVEQARNRAELKLRCQESEIRRTARAFEQIEKYDEDFKCACGFCNLFHTNRCNNESSNSGGIWFTDKFDTPPTNASRGRKIQRSTPRLAQL